MKMTYELFIYMLIIQYLKYYLMILFMHFPNKSLIKYFIKSRENYGYGT